MNTKNKTTYTSIVLNIFIILTLVFSIIMLHTTMAPCLNDKAMKCNASTSAVELLFYTLIVLYICDTVLYKLKVDKFRSCLIYAFSIITLGNTILLPYTVIGGCMKTEMACRTHTFPFIYAVSGILIILNIVGMNMKLKHKKGSTV